MGCFKKTQNTKLGGLVFLCSLVFLLFLAFYAFAADDLSSSAVDYVCIQPSQDVFITPCLPGGWQNGKVIRSGCGNPVTLKANTFYRVGAKNYFSKSVYCNGYEEINKKENEVFFLGGKQDRSLCNWSHECMQSVSSQNLSRSITNVLCQHLSDLRDKKEQVTFFVIEGAKQCLHTK